MGDFESEILFKWTNSCRLCLSTDCDMDIFSPDVSSLEILPKIQNYLNLLIYSGDPMPRKICNLCWTKLSEWSHFRDSCLETEKNLKTRLHPYRKIEFVQNYFDKLAKFTSSEVVSSSSKVVLKVPSMTYEEPNSSTEPKDEAELETWNSSKPHIPISQQLDKVFEDAIAKCPKPAETSQDDNSVLRIHPTAMAMVMSNTEVETPDTSMGTILSVTGGAAALWVANSEIKKERHVCPACELEFNTEDLLERHSCAMDVDLDSAPDASQFLESHLEEEEEEEEEVEGDASRDSTSLRRSNRAKVQTRRLYDEMIEEEELLRSCKPCPLMHKSKAASVSGSKMSPWKCIPCTQYFPSSQALSEHYSSSLCNSSYSNVFKCEFCTRQYTTYMELLQHQIVHIKVVFELTEDDLLCCPQCDLQFADMHRLERHRVVHSCTVATPVEETALPPAVTPSATETSFSCDACAGSFPSQEVLEEHRKTHTGAVRCLRCGRMCSSLDDLQRHESIKHKNPTPYMCRKCSLRFSIRSKLLLHLRSHLPKSDPDYCPLTEMELEAVNSDANTCKTCKAKFLYETDLHLHLKTHKAQPVKTEVRPKYEQATTNENGELLARYKCSLCSKVTVHPFSITRHGHQFHRGEKVVALRLKKPVPVFRHAPASPITTKVVKHRVKCTHCYKSFSSAANLSVHVNTVHAGQPERKPEPRIKQEPVDPELTAGPGALEGCEECPYCKLKFKKSYLRQHMKKVHKGEAIDRSTLTSEITADNSLVCKFCFKVCSTTYNRELHESIHSPNANKSGPSTCNACKKVFHHKFIYERHIKSCSVAKSFHCSVCNKLFFKFSAFQKHLCQLQSEESSTECRECGSNFASLNLLQVHMANSHGVQRGSWPSTSSGKSAPPPTPAHKERELWQEESNKIVCKVGDKFYCTLCDCEFSSPDDCREHQMFHPRGNWYAVQIHDSLYQCTICDKFFDSRKSALVHIDFHKQGLDNLPFQVTPSAQLTIPRPKSTAGIKRTFKCPLCISSFVSEENLNNHIFYTHPDVPSLP